MTTTTLSYSMVSKGILSKINPVRKITGYFSNGVNWKIVCFALFSVCALLLMYYVWQVSHLTQGTYMINSYEKQVSQLSKENKNLEVGFAESGFLSGVQQKIRVLDFHKTTSVKYIQIPANALAKAK